MTNGYDLRIIQPMSVPVAAMLCRLAKIRSIINNTVSWNESNAQISPGLLIETLVICILCDRKPLWKVYEFWENQDLCHLFPNEDIQLEWLNDDAYGHALDKLSDVNMELIISLVCLVLLQAHDLAIDRVHLDTTSKSVQGTYIGAPSICFGHSKDLRPDLKQIKIGLGVQQDGLPVAGEILAGNTSDIKWNVAAAVEMNDFFEKHQYKDILFVSDCAIVSTDNLKTLNEKKIRFVSRLPETFNLAERLKENAFQINQWIPVGNLTKNKIEKGAQYQLYSQNEELDGRRYRFIVVQSSALEAKKEKTLRKRVEKTKVKLEKEAEKLARQDFACEMDAVSALNALQNKVTAASFAVKSEVCQEEIHKHQGKGRPKKDQVPEITVVYRAKCSIGEMDLTTWEVNCRHRVTHVLA